MPAFAAIALLDGQATPVSHNFTPDTIDRNGVAVYLEKAGGIPVGFPQITLSLRKPSKTSTGRTYKVTAKVWNPVLEATSPSTATGIQPAPTKAYDLLATVEFVLPERSTLAQRKDIIALTKNLMANAQVVAAVQDLDSVW